jgi:adenosylhomocysteine nucleosidase
MIRILFITLISIVTSSSKGYAQSIVEVRPATVSPPPERSDITGILGAFPEEIKFLLSRVQGKTEFIIQRISFTEGTLNGQHVVIAQTGIGKVNAALTTILLIEHFHPKSILFTGIAGAINPDLSPGDLVIGTTLAHHDYGTLTKEGTTRRPTRDPSSMQENPVYFRSDTSLVKLAWLAGKELSLEKINGPSGLRAPQLISGTIVTGDVFVSSAVATKELRKEMNAEATEMEGAAVAQVSYQQHVPFLVIRSMSDNAGNTALTDIKDFYQIAARNSASFVMGILELQGKLKK